MLWCQLVNKLSMSPRKRRFQASKRKIRLFTQKAVIAKSLKPRYGIKLKEVEELEADILTKMEELKWDLLKNKSVKAKREETTTPQSNSQTPLIHHLSTITSKDQVPDKQVKLSQEAQTMELFIQITKPKGSLTTWKKILTPKNTKTLTKSKTI